MKSFLIALSFFGVVAGASAVYGRSTAGSAGSLYDFTTAMLAACPGSGGPYAGGVSGDGENAMLAGTQEVAPMSRFLDSAACTGAAASPDRSEGLVVGLDGVVLVGASFTAGGIACNGDPNETCDALFEPSTGAAYDTMIVGTDGSAYALQGWRDLLRVLFAGFSHDIVGRGPAQWARRNCNSPVRQALAADYGLFFETHCATAGGEAAENPTYNPNCLQIRHIFRPGDFSSSAETLVELLGLPRIVLPETMVGGILQHTGASPFCNAVRPSFVYPIPVMGLQGSDYTWDPTSTIVLANAREATVYRATMQDNDPIRRLCAGSGAGTGPAEDVCSHSGDLGLVLSINQLDETLPLGDVDRYNAMPCGRAKITSVAPPEVFDATNQAQIICATGLLCPNGDACNHFGGCFAPADASGHPNCLASLLTTPALTASLLAMPVANPTLPAQNDGRSYNQHLYDARGSYQVGNPAKASVTGAFHRIHTNHSLAPNGNTCQRPEMNDQVGCLAAASPCSLGLAGPRALVANGAIAAVKINRQSPISACMQAGHFSYPLTRKIYLNSIPGFAALEGQELALAGCMTNLAQPTLDPPTPAGLLPIILPVAGLLPIGPEVNGGQPFCEDFNESALCGAAVNADACQAVPLSFDLFPTYRTVCGNGQIEAFEDCDDGTANGPLPAACSADCRFNN